MGRKHTDDELAKLQVLEKEREKLWDGIRKAVKRLDEINDEGMIITGELYPDEVMANQILVNVVVAYSLQALDEDGEVEYMTSYAMPKGSSSEVVGGLLLLAREQFVKDTISD